MEIIEIGAVRLNAALTIVDEFDSFVRLVVEPKLSQFCTALTTIKQTDGALSCGCAAVVARNGVLLAGRLMLPAEVRVRSQPAIPERSPGAAGSTS